ncbi:hypothetical protein NL676_037486 [Syzygium grande]|nr:hypothetical protein NL676_037486 [Syzygium grande]
MESSSSVSHSLTSKLSGRKRGKKREKSKPENGVVVLVVLVWVPVKIKLSHHLLLHLNKTLLSSLAVLSSGRILLKDKSALGSRGGGLF